MYGEESQRDELKKGVLIGLMLFWISASIVQGFVGYMDSLYHYSCGPVRRIEVLFPGYRVARWIMKPIWKQP